MNKMKIICTILSLRKRLFLNHLRKTWSWLKVISVSLITLWIINFIVSGSYIGKLLYENYLHENIYFAPLLIIVSSLVFALTVIISVFAGGMVNHQDTSVTLLHYPIPRKLMVISDIISECSEPFSFLCFATYGILYFLAGNGLKLIPLLLFTGIFISFIFLLCCVIHLIKSGLALLVHSGLYRIFRWVFPLVFSLTVIYCLKIVSIKITDINTLQGFSNLLELLPSGVYAKFVISLNSGGLWQDFLFSFTYMSAVNILLLYSNYIVTAHIENRMFRQLHRTIPGAESMFSGFRLSFNPVFRKSLLYFFRSPKRVLNVLALFSFYIPFLYYLILLPIPASDKFSLILITELSFFFFHSSLILLLEGNFFGYDYSGVVNYYFLPVRLSDVIISKSMLSLCLAGINYLFAIFSLLLLDTSLSDLLLYTSFSFFTFFVFQFISIWLSILYPQKVEFYQIWGGINTAAGVWILSLLTIALFSVLLYFIMQIDSFITKFVLSAAFLSLDVIMFSRSRKFLSILSDKLYFRKELITAELK